MAAGVATALAWGLVGTLVRALPSLGALEVVAGRLLLALAAALPALAFPALRAQLAGAAGRRVGWGLAALLATYYLLAVPAFRLAPVADVALLLATTPLCALGMRRLRGARATAAERGGALLALAGVAVTLVPSFEAALGRHAAVAGAAPARLLGDLLALAAAATAAGYALVFRAAQERDAAPPPFGVAVLTFALGASAASLPAAARGAPLLPLDRLDARGFALLTTLGVVSTLVPSVTVAAAARRLPPVLATATTLLIPVVSALVAAAALGERPSAWLLPGGALVAAGLLRLIATATPPVHAAE